MLVITNDNHLPPGCLRDGDSCSCAHWTVFPLIEPALQASIPVADQSQAHCLWAVFIALICEVSPWLRPIGGEKMRTIAFITHSAVIRPTSDRTAVVSEPPRIKPARVDRHVAALLAKTGPQKLYKS
jgi:hypothetical protein